jgi:reverse gyrase
MKKKDVFEALIARAFLDHQFGNEKSEAKDIEDIYANIEQDRKELRREARKERAIMKRA